MLLAGLRPYLILAALCLALYLPGLASVPALDRDESRFAVASREMLENGDFVTVRFQDELRAKKPVGIYWLQAASAWASGAENEIWAYRLPSVLGALIAVLLTYRFGAALVGAEAALLGAALLAASLLAEAEARQATTDAALLACAVAAQGALGRFYLTARGKGPAPGWGIFLAFWIAQAGGILIKGPIVPALSLLTALSLAVWDRRWRWLLTLRPLPGIALAILLVAPWAILVSLATRGQFLGRAASQDLLSKLMGAQEAHAGAPGYYLALITLTLWPAAGFALPGFVRAVTERARPGSRFLLAWIVPFWILIEIVPTKLPHYILPAYPALALLGGAAASHDALFGRRWARAYFVLAALIGLALAAANIEGPIRLGGGFAPASLVPAAAALVCGIAPLALVWRGRPRRAVWTAALAAVPLWAGLALGVAPRLDSLWLSARLAHSVPAGAPVAMVGDHEASLVFELGTHTILTDAIGAARFLAATPGAVAVVEEASEPPFRDALAATSRTPRQIAEVRGINYSRGHPARLDLWTLAPP